MSDQPGDHILRLCGLLAVLAGALVVLGMQLNLADTAMSSVIDGIRFVLVIGVCFGAGLIMLDRRSNTDAPDVIVIDLRDDATAPMRDRSSPR